MLFSIGRREIFEQFDFVATRSFDNSEFEFGALYSGDLLRHFAGLMCAMRKLKPENVLPEFECAFEIRNRDSRVIGRDDAKRCAAHEIPRQDWPDSYETLIQKILLILSIR